MKKTAVLFLLVLAALSLGGCMLPSGYAKDARPGMTKFDAKARVYRSAEIQRQQIWDDFDHFWMLERPGRMHELAVR